MAFKKHENGRATRHYARRATKRRPGRPPVHPGRIVAIVAAVLAVIAGALIWGSALKKKSDAYRASESDGVWTVDETAATPLLSPSEHPDVHLLSIRPEGNVGDIIIYASHNGVLLPLNESDGTLCYMSAVGTEAGRAILPEAPELIADVARVSRRNLHVAAMFTVTYPSAPDKATAVYRRGLDLALLCEYATAGMDTLLIAGLPAGDEASDRDTVSFLQELRAVLNSQDTAPTVGVVIPLTALAGDVREDGTPLYAGHPSPVRLLRTCDFLTLDLRGMDIPALEALLPQLSYAYVRYSLYTMADAPAEVLSEHGFRRIFEMNGHE